MIWRRACWRGFDVVCIDVFPALRVGPGPAPFDTIFQSSDPGRIGSICREARKYLQEHQEKFLVTGRKVGSRYQWADPNRVVLHVGDTETTAGFLHNVVDGSAFGTMQNNTTISIQWYDWEDLDRACRAIHRLFSDLRTLIVHRCEGDPASNSMSERGINEDIRELYSRLAEHHGAVPVPETRRWEFTIWLREVFCPIPEDLDLDVFPLNFVRPEPPRMFLGRGNEQPAGFGA